MAPAAMEGEKFFWPRWPESSAGKERAVIRALRAGRWAVAGPVTEYASHRDLFADRFALYIGRAHAVPTFCGSDAIVIALQALGIGPGNRVLLPALTWVGCATAVLRVGATPIFCDSSSGGVLGDYAAPDAGRIDAVLAVHTYASRLDMAALQKRFVGVPIVEDFSHCHGALLPGGQRAGRAGEISICSFQASKLLTCGEGGCALTDDRGLAEQMIALSSDSRLRNGAGQPLEPAHLRHGANHALSELNASIVLAHLQELPEELERRAVGLRAFVTACDDLGITTMYTCEALQDGAIYAVPFRLPEHAHRDVAETPERLIERVRSLTGLSCERTYPPIPASPLYRPGTVPLYTTAVYGTENLRYRVAENVHSEWLTVPHWAMLATPEQIIGLAHAIASDTRRSASFPTPLKQPTCTVVVLTRNRREALVRALTSVAAQVVSAEVRVLLVNNGGPVDITRGDFAQLSAVLCIECVNVSGPFLEALSQLQRIAHLRRFAVSLVSTDLVTFLDDDNAWTPLHLASLLEVMQETGVAAVHSWRTVEDADGRSVPLSVFPWARTEQERLLRMADAVGAGWMSAGSSEVHDTVARANGSPGMVDMGCWMFRYSVLKSIGFMESFSDEDAERIVGEDDKLLADLVTHGVPTACTRKATLRYALGGMSNGFASKMEAISL